MQIDQVVSEIHPVLEALEVDRRKLADARKKYYLILIPILLVMAVVAVGFFPIGIFIALAGGGITLGIIYHNMVGKHRTAFVSAYKGTVIEKLVKLVDPNLAYASDRGIPESDFVDSELFTTRPDRYSTEDLIYGDHGKTSLQLAEIDAEEKRTSRDSKGRTSTSYVTIFNGLLLIADFHKDFKGRTFVLPDTAESLFGGFGRTLQSFGGGRSGTKLAQMEDVEFEKEFAVYTSDQVEARYVLTPSMMERIRSMRARFGADVRIAFKDSSVWIAVPHSQPYLEPTDKVAATDTSQIRRMLGEMMPFLDTIDELDLNTRIWTKA